MGDLTEIAGMFCIRYLENARCELAYQEWLTVRTLSEEGWDDERIASVCHLPIDKVRSLSRAEKEPRNAG